MEVESDDDDYADAVHYDDITDEDLHVTNSCKPLSMHSFVPSLVTACTLVRVKYT